MEAASAGTGQRSRARTPLGHTHLSVFASPQAEETSFHFDGSGFSLVQKSLRATSTSIVLLFKTLSPGGLLLYLASNNTVHTPAHTGELLAPAWSRLSWVQARGTLRNLSQPQFPVTPPDHFSHQTRFDEDISTRR